MKRIIVLYTLVLFTTSVRAQPSYPVSTVKPNLSKLEYFFNSDPGFGNGQQVSLSPGTSAAGVQFQANLSGLAPGFHRLYVRAMDTDNRWSHSHNSYFDNYVVPVYPSASPSTVIRRMEYFVDIDPGFGLATEIPVSESAHISQQTATVSVAGLNSGVHQIFVRALDATGKWSLAYYGVFDNSLLLPYPAAPPAPGDISELEYFIDNDPGFGNGTKLAISPAANLNALSFDIPVTDLNEGAHHIYLRARQNPWSMAAVASFNLGTVLPVTWLYVKGELRAGKSTISWATAMEEDTDRFILEHSRNGSQFSEVATVAAAGNSGSIRNYQAEHGNLEPGMHYYRIRQVDVDGNYSYSKIISLLNNDRLREAVIAPNPVGDMLHLVEPQNIFVNKLEIYDVSGRLLQVKRVEGETKVISMNTSSLLQGQYFLKVYYKESSKTFAIVKM